MADDRKVEDDLNVDADDRKEKEAKPAEPGKGTYVTVQIAGCRDFLPKPQLRAISDNGFEHPSEFQHQFSVPQAIPEQDIVAQAKSGKGKTTALVLSTLQQLDDTDEKYVQCMVMVHTRDLACQIKREYVRFAKYKPFAKIAVFVGGTPIDKDKETLQEGGADFPNIVVATPGRALGLVSDGDLRLNKVKFFALDEAEPLLEKPEMRRDLQEVFSKCPAAKQVMMFLATQDILKTARDIMNCANIHPTDAERGPRTVVDRGQVPPSGNVGRESVCSQRSARDFTVPAEDKGGPLIRGARYGNRDAVNKVLLVMGFGGSQHYWSNQTTGGAGCAALWELTNCEVAVFDNRGAGASHRPWGTYTTKAMAHDAMRVLQHIQWYATDVRLHVVGHSMGGMIAQHLVHSLVRLGHPPATLALLTTHNGGWRVLPAVGSVPRLAWCAAKAAVSRSAKAALDNMIPVLHSRQYASVEVSPGTTGAQQQAAVYGCWPPWTECLTEALPGVLGHASAVATHSFSDQKLRVIRASTVRCLVMFTDHDGVIPPCHSRHLAVVLQCPTAKVPTGHMLMQETPGSVNAILVAHFNGNMHTHADTTTEGTQWARRVVGVPASLGVRGAVVAARATEWALLNTAVGRLALAMGKRCTSGVTRLLKRFRS